MKTMNIKFIVLSMSLLFCSSIIFSQEEEYLVSIHIESFKNVVHSSDCSKIQGKIKVGIISQYRGKEYFAVDGMNTLLNLKESKKTNFDSIGFENISFKEVQFLLPKKMVTTCSFVVRIYPDELRGCHKSCGFCADYHCDVRYKGGINRIQDFKERCEGGVSKRIFMNERSNRGSTTHYLDIEVAVEVLR